MTRYFSEQTLLDMRDKDMNYVYDLTDLEEYLAGVPTADVAPRAEVEELQECIYDLYAMLEKIIDSAKRYDLSALRPFRGASGCDGYQGLPPICRKYDELLDKHEEAIHKAANFTELKKKYTESE